MSALQVLYMELRDFDTELLRHERIFVEDRKYQLKLFEARTNFQPRYYNDFKKYPSKNFPFFVLCYKHDKYISLFKTKEDAEVFFSRVINKSEECTKQEFSKFISKNMFLNKQLRYKYGRF